MPRLTRAQKDARKAKEEASKASQNTTNNKNASTSPAAPSQQDSALHSDSIGPSSHTISARETQDLMVGGNKVAEPVIEINTAEVMHVERAEKGSAVEGFAVERSAEKGLAEKGSVEKDFAEKGSAHQGSAEKGSAEIARDGTNGAKRASSSKCGEEELVSLQPSKLESRQKQRVAGSSSVGNKGFSEGLSGRNSDQFQGYKGEYSRREGGRQGGYQSDGRGRGGGGYGYRNQGGGDNSRRIEALGRKLSHVLRHQAVQLGLKVRSDGYVVVKDLLSLSTKTLAGLPLYSYSVDDLKEAVKRDDKQRFGLHEENDQLMIRANQGHSIRTIESEGLLKRIFSPEEVPVCIHGTYLRYLESIEKDGLKRMNRNHVHFATGLSKKDGVISGMRSSCQVFIYLNVQKALKDGMKLYRSENGVILAEGFDGVVPPEYFANIERHGQKGNRNV